MPPHPAKGTFAQRRKSNNPCAELGWDREDPGAPLSTRRRLRAGRLQRLADRLRFSLHQLAVADNSGAEPGLRARRLCAPAAHRAHEPQDPAAEERAELHRHRRRISGRSGQSRPHGRVQQIARRLSRGWLDRSGAAQSDELLADGRRFRAQPALSRRAVQHPLSVRAWPGRRLPEGDRHEPAQAPSRPLLGAEPRAGRRAVEQSGILAERRSSAHRGDPRSGSGPERGTLGSPSPSSPSSSPTRPRTTSTPSAISSLPSSKGSAPSGTWRGGAPAKRWSPASITT